MTILQRMRSEIHNEEQEASQVASQIILEDHLFVQQEDQVSTGGLMKTVDELSRRKNSYDGDVLQDTEGVDTFRESNKRQYGSSD